MKSPSNPPSAALQLQPVTRSCLTQTGSSLGCDSILAAGDDDDDDDDDADDEGTHKGSKAQAES